jgi:hypothetical protein
MAAIGVLSTGEAKKATASRHIYKFTPQMRIMAPIHDI